MTAVGSCYFCGKELRLDRVGFRALCPECDEPLHACVQCEFYALGQPHDCREPNIEPVRDKETNNVCDWFRFGADSKGGDTLSKEDAASLLKDLFS